MDRKVWAMLGRMSPNDVGRLLARLERTTARKRSHLEKRKNALLRRVAVIDRELASLPGAAARAAGGRRGRPAGARRSRKGGPTSRDVAYEVLRKHGGTMELKDLAKAVLTSGRFRSSSPVFAQNLGTALRQDSRFRKVGRGRYAAAGGAAGSAPGSAASRKTKTASRPGRKRRGRPRKRAGGRGAKRRST